MSPPSTTIGKPRSRGRIVLLACLNCAQMIAPDWPLLILWPCIKISLASSNGSVVGPNGCHAERSQTRGRENQKDVE